MWIGVKEELELGIDKIWYWFELVTLPLLMLAYLTYALSLLLIFKKWHHYEYHLRKKSMVLNSAFIFLSFIVQGSMFLGSYYCIIYFATEEDKN